MLQGSKSFVSTVEVLIIEEIALQKIKIKFKIKIKIKINNQSVSIVKNKDIPRNIVNNLQNVGIVNKLVILVRIVNQP